MAMFKKKPGGLGEDEKKPPSMAEMGMDLAADTSKSAAQDLIDAVHAKDSGAVDSALKAHYEACQDAGGEGEAEEKPGGLGVDDEAE